MSPTLIIALYILAVVRVTRLINFDTIMYWLHNLVGNRFGPGSWQAEFIACPWCVSMWVGLFTAWAPLLFFGFASWYLYAISYVLFVLAASLVAGLLEPLTSDDTDFEKS